MRVFHDHVYVVTGAGPREGRIISGQDIKIPILDHAAHQPVLQPGLVIDALRVVLPQRVVGWEGERESEVVGEPWTVRSGQVLVVHFQR